MHIYKLCQTTSRIVATKMDREFDSSLSNLKMRSLNLSFLLRVKQVETLFLLHCGHHRITMFSTGSGRVILSVPPVDRNIESHDQEIVPNMAYNLSESITACQKWASSSE